MPESRKEIFGYFFNIISLIGMILATVATGLIIVLLSVELITGVESPYLGILVYFIFPAMLVLGLLLVPIGAYRVRKQHRRGAPDVIPLYPDIDPVSYTHLTLPTNREV